MRSDGALFSRFEITPRGHTRALPSMLDTVLQEAGIGKPQLQQVAFANGPGAFTGVRIAAAMAQGISLALDIPLTGVSTLAVLAQQVMEREGVDRVQAMIDARMGEAYVACYERDAGGLARLQGEERLVPLEAIEFAPGFTAAGSALKALIEAGLETPPGDAEALPHAAALARLAAAGRGRSSREAPINYLRNQVAVRKAPTVY